MPLVIDSEKFVLYIIFYIVREIIRWQCHSIRPHRYYQIISMNTNFHLISTWHDLRNGVIRVATFATFKAVLKMRLCLFSGQRCLVTICTRRLTPSSPRLRRRSVASPKRSNCRSAWRTTTRKRTSVSLAPSSKLQPMQKLSFLAFGSR